MRTPITWNKLWISMVDLVAQRSKDPETQCGAVLVSPDNRRVHIGYNGMPTRVSETKERWQRPDKYWRVIHAEANAILNAKEDVAGWTLYLSIPPCSDCCKLIIQAGIKQVYYKNEPNTRSQLDYTIGKEMFEEGEVELCKIHK